MKFNSSVEEEAILLKNGQTLPEGTRVTVSGLQTLGGNDDNAKHRITLPLVGSLHPGTLQMTAERVAELLDEQDSSIGEPASPRLSPTFVDIASPDG